ncbi:endogenous retrovirus group k member 5 gag poly [Limosa lapponica baueri]|uniref:Endogenous retrovirus group k member 5 gag poly n=1 Tax=Limosa lapponica baueri TaxID=1758121 RepID=A0A2I0UF17_LIMLA|nr:endogenous retrovirus group k member 5 gag poly [Limosa lapponica baueri]
MCTDGHYLTLLHAKPLHVQSISVWDKCRKEALAKGDADISQAFPVIYRGNRPGAREALSYDHVKELRKSVKDYGLQSGYTMNLLTAVGDGYVVTRHDWELLLRVMLSAVQCAGFMTEYRDLATAKHRIT